MSDTGESVEVEAPAGRFLGRRAAFSCAGAGRTRYKPDDFRSLRFVRSPEVVDRSDGRMLDIYRVPTD